MNLPKRITPCPIVDSVVELRFETSIPPDAVFGVFFAELRKDFAKFDRLPISEVPEVIRKQDQNLRFSPFYQATQSPFILRVGPQVISLSCAEQYAGWDLFFDKLKDIIRKIEKTETISKFIRIGIRYIDFFENNIYDHVKLSVALDGEPFVGKQKTIRAIVDKDIFTATFQLANNTTATLHGKEKNGSIIDTDTFLETQAGLGFNEIPNLIDQCHTQSKSLFFGLLKNEFISTLNPEY